MREATPFDDVVARMEDFLRLPPDDARFTEGAEKLAEALRLAGGSSDTLRRYRERKRMGPPRRDPMGPPNLPYTISAA